MVLIDSDKIKLSLVYFLFGMMLLGSCGKKSTVPEQKNIPVKNMDFLNSLTKVESYELENIEIDSTTLVYNEEGRLLSSMEVARMIASKDYMMDYFRNKKGEIIFVLEYMSEEVKLKRAILDSLSKAPTDLTGKAAIPFTLKDMDDQEVSLEKLEGKVVVLNFWFIGCGPCIAEMPELNKLVEEYKNKNKDIVFLGISTDSKEKLVPFLKKKTFNYHILHSGEKVCNQYQVWGFPTHVIIGKNSIISYYYSGTFDQASIGHLKDKIDRALAE